MLNTYYKHFSRFALAIILAFGSTFLQAKDSPTASELVSITDAWVRQTNPGQEVGAAYMTFTSKQDLMLVSVESDVTDSIEIHNMTMENGVMKMRMMENLPLKAGKPYKLAPGGFHLMLFDLKKPLVAGEQVNFVLHFKNNMKAQVGKKKNAPEFKQAIKVMVKVPPEEASH
jgi:hypothetical protein